MDAVLPDRYTIDRISTPIGVAVFVTDTEGRLAALDWLDFEERLVERLRARAGREAVLSEGQAEPAVRAALQRYFDGETAAVDTVTCHAPGTSFQQTVWKALRTIATGTTATYGELATRIGAPRASRAVGLANNRNPIAVVVPCHRVIGADGSLTGYAGGLDRKRWLLDHEARYSKAAERAQLWMESTACASSTSSGDSRSMRAMSAR
jgi:methylated-DNA-[protein]-cysteine S-methyltransferase